MIREGNNNSNKENKKDIINIYKIKPEELFEKLIVEKFKTTKINTLLNSDRNNLFSIIKAKELHKTYKNDSMYRELIYKYVKSFSQSTLINIVVNAKKFKEQELLVLTSIKYINLDYLLLNEILESFEPHMYKDIAKSLLDNKTFIKDYIPIVQNKLSIIIDEYAINLKKDPRKIVMVGKEFFDQLLQMDGINIPLPKMISNTFKSKEIDLNFFISDFQKEYKKVNVIEYEKQEVEPLLNKISIFNLVLKSPDFPKNVNKDVVDVRPGEINPTTYNDTALINENNILKVKVQALETKVYQCVQ